MKPFDLKEAKAGKRICNGDGIEVVVSEIFMPNREGCVLYTQRKTDGGGISFNREDGTSAFYDDSYTLFMAPVECEVCGPMTKLTRDRLLTACAFAKVFIANAYAELQGAPSEPRLEAAAQLAEALAQLNGDRDDEICTCTHDLTSHEGSTGGMCLINQCPCLAFDASL